MLFRSLPSRFADYFSYTDDFENVEITGAEEEYILGTTEIDYTDSVYSAPMMSSIAYQCVLLRVSEDQDIETAKKLLEENADPAKWICVEAESVVVENVGDVILFIMADKDVADAAKEAFLALKNEACQKQYQIFHYCRCQIIDH